MDFLVTLVGLSEKLRNGQDRWKDYYLYGLLDGSDRRPGSQHSGVCQKLTKPNFVS